MLIVSWGAKSIKSLSCAPLLTAVDCGTLINPANGQVTHTGRTTFGQTATYSCGTGYNLVGDSDRTCQATGAWSGSEPICQSTLLKELEHYACVHRVVVYS